MCVRKLIRGLNSKERQIIHNDISNIMNKCEIIACTEFNKQKEAKDFHNNNCPNCHEKKDKIINVINHVKGKTEVITSHNFFSNSTKTITDIDTYEVNHCTSCGNEWKKYIVKYVSKSEIVRVAIKYLAEYLTNPNEKIPYKLEVINVFENCYVESIIHLCKEYKDYRTIKNAMKILKPFVLRKYFKSIYKKTNNIKSL